MFESTLEAQSLHTGERRFRTVSAVALLYLAGVSFLAVVAAFTVRPIIGPPLQPTIYIIKPPPEPGPRLPLVASAPRPSQGGRHEAPRPIAPAPVTPATTPATLPTPAPAPPIDGTGEVGPGGSDGPDLGPPGGPGGGSGPPNGTGGGSDDVGPVTVTGEMIAPVRVFKVDPVYPNAARIARMSGKVVVQAVIGLDGRVESTEVLASTSPLFDAAAMEAVRQWRYTPATMNGRPVRVYFSVRVEFVLR